MLLTVIYADILLVLNLAADYLLLFATARLAGVKFIRLRGLFSAFVGALYSLIILFGLPKTVLVLTRILSVLIMVLVAFGKRKIKEVIRLGIIFYVSSFIFSGFMLLINSFANTRSFFAENGIIYFEFSAMGIVVSCVLAFLITEILRRIFRHGEAEGSFIAKIYYGGNCTVLKGFTDTGNSLTEPFNGTPVAVTSPDSLKYILPESFLSAMENKDLSTEHNFRLIPCNTVSGSVLMAAFRPGKVVIANENGEFEAEDLLVAISEFAPENTLIIGKNAIFKEKNKIFSEV